MFVLAPSVSHKATHSSVSLWYSTNVPLYQTSSSHLTSTHYPIIILDCFSTERLFYSLGCTYCGIKYPCCTKENFYAIAASLTKADVYAKAALLYILRQTFMLRLPFCCLYANCSWTNYHCEIYAAIGKRIIILRQSFMPSSLMTWGFPVLVYDRDIPLSMYRE